jgi:hypothetical protein
MIYPYNRLPSGQEQEEYYSMVWKNMNEVMLRKKQGFKPE